MAGISEQAKAELIAEARGFANAWRANSMNADVIYSIERMEGEGPDRHHVHREVSATMLLRMADELEAASLTPEPSAQGLVVAPCARCGKPILASAPDNPEMEVCGDCGVNVGRSMEAPEPSSDVREAHATLADRVRAVVEVAIGDSMTVENDRCVGAAEHAAVEAERTELLAVRDAVLAVLRTDGDS